MTKGILLVETDLTSPELVGEFNRQYDEIHLPEMLAIEGVVAARRFEPVGHEGPFVAVYEIEADDLDAVAARVVEAGKGGRLTTPEGVRTDPPPRVRWLRQIASV